VLERLAIEAVEVRVAAGSRVVTEGEPGETFYVIARGTAAVTREGLPIRELGPGSWFGELALLDDSPRSATVTAQTDLDLHAVGRDAFLASVGVSSRLVAQQHARDHYR
jgi:CRP-like cAMP-binding protein